MNLGGYDRNDFNESLGNSILKSLLQSHSGMYGHFEELDKTPNMDGYFDILKDENKKSVPVGKIEVQIKTLDHDYLNLNKTKNRSKYKYSCDTKIFNVVKEAITLNPCILFMVDVKDRRVFYKYISLEYALSMNIEDEANKMVYFGEEDEITNIDAFYEKVKYIYESRRKESLDEKASHFITNNNLSTNELIMLQNEFDYLNGAFNKELSYIKKRMFPHVWKFGLAYLKDDNVVGIGIYWICKGQQGEYFKKLNANTYRECSHVQINYRKNKDVRELINLFIKQVLEEAFKNNVFSLEFVKDEVLEEIAFYFLDKVASIEKTFENPEKPSVYYRNEEDVDVLESYYTALIQYGYEKYTLPPVSVSPNSSGTYLCDPMADICNGHAMNQNRARLQYLLLHPEIRDEIRINICLSGKFAYRIIYETISEIKERKIGVVHRVWKTRDWKAFERKQKGIGLFRIENGYTIDDFYDNLEKLIFKIPENYNYLLDNCPEYGEELRCKKEYVFVFEKSEEFTLKTAVYRSELFNTKIDESMRGMSFDEMCDILFKQEGCLGLSSGGCEHTFSEDFPLLKNMHYVLMCALMQKYNISDWKDKNEYLCR